MSMSRWNPIYSYLLNLIMTCLGVGQGDSWQGQSGSSVWEVRAGKGGLESPQAQKPHLPFGATRESRGGGRGGRAAGCCCAWCVATRQSVQMSDSDVWSVGCCCERCLWGGKLYCRFVQVRLASSAGRAGGGWRRESRRGTT
jgi:hypothetical protein